MIFKILEPALVSIFLFKTGRILHHLSISFIFRFVKVDFQRSATAIPWRLFTE